MQILHSFLNKLYVFGSVYAADYEVKTVDIGFKVPDIGTVLTFLLRTFFVMSGIITILYLLLGAFSWITSGGNKENVDKAREKIQAALVGMILIFSVLAIVTLIEQVLFPAGSGLGLTKPIKFQRLIQ
ncbi:hypothetical protein HY041_00710 [Candidatus Roizmanbacteria bacterium]|nr:hypothetical protein [Candidatus Roizmanbacteria bacterium]